MINESKPNEPPDRHRIFEQWASSYDVEVRALADFPFAGYEQVLDTIVREAQMLPDMPILDLGTGTGNLALRFVQQGGRVVAADFSDAMLARAGEKVPQARLLKLDLTSQDWGVLGNQPFERIVAAYVFHEFPLARTVGLIQRLAADHLTASGRIVLGDIAFPTVAVRDHARHYWAGRWDESEHYWAADEALPALQSIGFQASYAQVSCCAGVFTIQCSQSA